MKLGIRDHVDATSGVQEETRVSFEANGVAFYATISGIAKDKIGYPVRELSTNAWDASRGNFEVQLPTNLNPIFRVRDYGAGMSPDAMKNVYARIFASTKRKSNDEVGGWGLGSKSPFAYLITDTGCGSYNVTSYYEGVMRTYTMSLAQDGTPVLRLILETPSNEPSGMDVSFAVRREDVSKFRDAAKAILWSFAPQPRILPEVVWPVAEVISSGEGWTSYDKDSVPFSGPHVRMGCVMYPFDLRQIDTDGILISSDRILFEAPIGSLKVTTSREELAYDDTTKATLAELVRRYEVSLKAQIQATVDAAETYFAACSDFDDVTDHLGDDRETRLRNHIRWRGRKLHKRINGNSQIDFPASPFKTMVLREGWKFVDKFDHQTINPEMLKDYTVVMEHNPSYSFPRLMMAGLTEKPILWVRTKRLFRNTVLDILGNPEVVDLDAFKVAVEDRPIKTMRRRRTLQVTIDGSDTHVVTQMIDMAQGGIYVESSDGNAGRMRRRYQEWYSTGDVTGYQSLNRSNLDRVIEFAVRHNILEPGAVILIKPSDSAALGENWVDLKDFIVDDLKGMIDRSVFNDIHGKTKSSLNDGVRTLATARLRHIPVDIEAFRSDARELFQRLNASDQPTLTDKVIEILMLLGVNTEKPAVDCPVDAMNRRLEALKEKYPLLDMTISAHAWSRTANALDYYLEMECAKQPALLAEPPPSPDMDAPAMDIAA